MLAVWQHIYIIHTCIYIYVCVRVILYRLYYCCITYHQHSAATGFQVPLCSPGSCRNPLASCNNAKAWLWSTSDAAMTCANCNAVSCSGAEPLENTILEWATVAHWNAPSMKRMCKFKGTQIWALKVRNPALASSWEGARSSAEQLQQLWHFQTWNARPKFGRQILDRDFMWESVRQFQGLPRRIIRAKASSAKLRTRSLAKGQASKWLVGRLGSAYTQWQNCGIMQNYNFIFLCKNMLQT